MDPATEPIVWTAALVLGLVGGFKHAFEPDHVIAVSTLVHREPRLSRAVRMGLLWGTGHTAMLVLSVGLIGLLRVQVDESWLVYFEVPVAVMLLAIGGWALRDTVRGLSSLRVHQHDGVPHYHTGEAPHPHAFWFRRDGWAGFGVGMVHGLAGSGALLLLVAATLPTVTQGIMYALVYGMASIIGMGGVTLGLAIPFLSSRSRPHLHHSLAGLSGVLSMGLGGVLLVQAVLG